MRNWQQTDWQMYVSLKPLPSTHHAEQRLNNGHNAAGVSFSLRSSNAFDFWFQ